jgi:prepilin-type N-terminal cleavage/methylation domain-containing protein
VRRIDGGVHVKSRLRSRLGVEDGFTLMELVITVAIVGMIVVPLTGVVLAYLRNTVNTQARLTESHDVQLAAAYWQRDVASIGVRSNTYDTASHSFPLEQSVGLAPCGLPAGASAVVTLAWSEYSSLTSTDPPQLVKVTYSSRAVGAVYELIRVRCGSQPSTIELANNLTAAPSATCHKADGTATGCGGGGAAVPVLVKLPLSVHDNSSNLTTYTATLTGERRQT